MWIILVPVSACWCPLVSATEKNSPMELSPRRMQLGYFRVMADPFLTASGHLAVFAFTQRAFGDEVQNPAGVVISGEPVLHRGIFHLGIFVNNHLDYRRMQLVAVAHRGGTPSI